MKHIFIYFIFVITLFLLTFSGLKSQVFWEERNAGVTVSLNCVSDIDAYKVWICGDSGSVLRSTNGGYIWFNVTGNGIPANIRLINIFGVNSSIALTAGYKDSNTYLYRTSNSGANWNLVFTQPGGLINAVWMTSDSTGFMQGNPVGGRWSLWRTTNGGINWDSAGLFLPQIGGESGWKNSFSIANNKIWFGTNNGKLYYSDSTWLHWYSIPTTPDLNTFAVYMDFSSPLIGFYAGTSFYKTTNGGLNWAMIPSPGSGNFNSITGRTLYFNYFWYIRSSSNIYLTYGGSGGNISYTAPSGIYNHIAMTRGPVSFGPGFVFAVRNNGGISRGNMIVEGVRIISSNIPASFELYQNYPNPFNSSTKLKFDSRILPSSVNGEVRGGLIRLSVYDILGKEVEVLVDKVIQPGIYEISWNGNNYPSGVYFYRLLVSDPNGFKVLYDKILKMVLIK